MKLLELLDHDLAQIESDEKGQSQKHMEADRFLWIATQCYSAMRLEQEDKAEEAEGNPEIRAPRLDDMPSPEEDDNEPPPEQGLSAQEKQENVIKDMDPEVQMKVHRTADRMLKQLSNLGT